MRPFILNVMYLLVIITLISCSSNKNENSRTSGRSNNEDGSDVNRTYHTDSRYKYEYRTGTSGNYEYNYDVNGMDENGNYVSGNVSMNGKYGDGFIETDDGDQIDIDAEWVGSGEIEAIDGDGKTYELEVD